MHYQEEVVLCGSSRYTRKFYLNPDFEQLPDDIKKELKVTCALYTEDVGGTIQLIFDEKGNLQIRTDAEEGDMTYDMIGAGLKVKEMQHNKADLFMRLEMYYKIFALGMDPEELEQEVREGTFDSDGDEDE